MSSTPARTEPPPQSQQSPQSRSGRTRRNLLDLLASMRFAIALLVILAIASIIGTVIKQDDPYPNYVNQFGPFWADIFRTLDMYTVYSAWWFMLILAFLIVSVSMCVTRNGPKMIADARNWKDKVRESSLRSFGHRDEFSTPAGQVASVTALESMLKRAGYKMRTRQTDGATLIAAKKGAFSRIGYIFAHLAIVIICIGGLLDSNLMIRAQVWFFGKSPVVTSAPLATIGEEHRLSSVNPSFRGYAWVPEGQYVSTAILNEKDGIILQNLPFSIQLNKFIVDYYSTGMPKLFASDIVVIDRDTGKRTPARVEVNKPFTYDGISIYQSSFEDGGTKLDLTGYPMTGASMNVTPYKGIVGGTTKLPDGDTIEFADFRSINVENMGGGAAGSSGGPQDARGVARSSLKEDFESRLGSGATSSRPQNLHNIGPSLQYKIRDQAGQAREYNNYMVPTVINGEQMFLAGVRTEPDAPFRYLRIPADDDSSVKQWMLLRAALQNPGLRAAAAKAFAARSVGSNAALGNNLEQSAGRVLNLFAGAEPDGSAPASGSAAEPNPSGFPAIAAFIERSVPTQNREKAAQLLLRMLEGSIWDLWQLARVQDGAQPLAPTAEHSRFVQNSINALSDSFYYGSPVFLQLDNFHQIQASVFQLTRAPGEKIVYLGSLFLVLGVFSMFYIKERRVWIWIRPKRKGDQTLPLDGSAAVAVMSGAHVSADRDASAHVASADPLPSDMSGHVVGGDAMQSDGEAHILMAMSSARKTLDFEKEFVRMRDAIRQTAPPADVPASGSTPPLNGTSQPFSAPLTESPDQDASAAPRDGHK
jgi:cytochrome c biogenesis protein